MQGVAGLLARKQADLAKRKELKEAELKGENVQKKDVAASTRQQGESPGTGNGNGKKMSFKDLMGHAATVDNKSLELNLKVRVRESQVPSLLKKTDRGTMKSKQNRSQVASQSPSLQANTLARRPSPPKITPKSPPSSMKPNSSAVRLAAQDSTYQQGDIWRMFHGNKRRRPSYSESSDDMEVAGEDLIQEEWRSYQAGQREDREEERREREREEAKRKRKTQKR